MEATSITMLGGLKVKFVIGRSIGFLAAIVCVIGITAGCGASAATDGAEHAISAGIGGSSGAVDITDFAGRKVSFDKMPERIVALGSGEVDIIYALGGEVVGRPDTEDSLPNEKAAAAAKVGSTHTVDLEKIAVLKPDVLLGNDPLNLKDVPLLENIGAKVVLTHANSVEDIQEQIELIGRLLGKEERAAELIGDIEEGLAKEAKKQARDTRVLLVYGAPGTYLAALPNSLSGDILAKAGGVNVAGEFQAMQNFPQYAQLNTERVVQSNPEVILIMTHGSSEEVEKGFVREMEGSPAWNALSAVREGRIHVLPADLFGTNPGTRVLEAIALLQELLEP
ncbi:ABC transporter substrate-binding protein [Paenibacillus sp. CAU 1782]